MKQTSLDVLEFVNSKEDYVTVEEIQAQFPNLTLRNINGTISSLTKLHKKDGVVTPLFDIDVSMEDGKKVTKVRLNIDGKNFLASL